MVGMGKKKKRFEILVEIGKKEQECGNDIIIKR
jgi:hypothetical protein